MSQENYKLNYSFFLNREIAKHESTEHSPISSAIRMLMLATGVYKLFDRTDYIEFVKRIFIICCRTASAESYFTDDNILKFTKNGELYEITSKTLEDYCGVCTFNRHVATIDFDSWFLDLDKHLFNATILSIYDNVDIFNAHYRSSNTSKLDTDSKAVEFVEHLRKLNLKFEKLEIKSSVLENAFLISEVIVKELKEDTFINWLNAFPNVLAEYNEEISRKADFTYSYDVLSDEEKNEIKEHFDFFFSEDDFVRERKKIDILTHVAWLWTNKYIFFDEQGYPWVDGLQKFDDMDESLELPDGGFNLEMIVDHFNLEAIETSLLIKMSHIDESKKNDLVQKILNDYFNERIIKNNDSEIEWHLNYLMSTIKFRDFDADIYSKEAIEKIIGQLLPIVKERSQIVKRDKYKLNLPLQSFIQIVGL